MNNLEDILEFVIIPETAESEYRSWTVDHTNMLIELYGIYRPKLGSFEIKSLKKLWEVISQKLNETYKIKVSPSNVENRWRVLDRNYKKYIDNNKQTGRGRKIFPYAEQMDEILGKKKNIKPEILLATSTIDETSTITDIDNPTTEKANNEIPLIHKEKKVKASRILGNRNAILAGIRKDRKEYQENRMKLEKEKLLIQKEKVIEMRRKNDLLAERNILIKNTVTTTRENSEFLSLL